MPAPYEPPSGHPHFLTRSGERASAALAISGSLRSADAALVAADTLDLTAQAVLSAAGIADREEQRAILRILWG